MDCGASGEVVVGVWSDPVGVLLPVLSAGVVVEVSTGPVIMTFSGSVTGVSSCKLALWGVALTLMGPKVTLVLIGSTEFKDEPDDLFGLFGASSTGATVFCLLKSLTIDLGLSWII
jgi:hypothetical protein